MVTPSIPDAYTAFFTSGALTEGFMEGDPGYFVLWRPDEIAQNNKDVEIEKYAPGFIAFGGNGGGELLAFDNRGAVVMLPMIGMEPRYANKIAGSWDEFEKRIRDTARP